MSGRESDNLIQLHAVSKEFKTGPVTVHAVEHASLTLKRGEFVLLQGPSGSGKTTLLSIMGLLMKPTRGRVWLGGNDVTGYGEDQLPALRLKHIGFIFQSYNLFPALTALQNITLALQLKGFGWRERKRESQALLDRVGLADCMNRRPDALSGGQRQRVCIARAMAGNSDVILADEPTAALDTATGLSVMALLRDEVLAGRRAALVVTHDPRLERFATRVDHITDGKLTIAAPLEKGTVILPSVSKIDAAAPEPVAAPKEQVAGD
ncbi:MAG: ABC transporter ATP-binding protein [Planctomycetota bacterium]|nr:ABC transporter ATP-binding protein [Planctomycetota bacterium]